MGRQYVQSRCWQWPMRLPRWRCSGTFPLDEMPPSFPPESRLYTGSDYPSSNEYTSRDPLPYVTVGEQEKKHKRIKND